MTVKRISFRKRIAMNLFRKYKENETKIHSLSYVFWECTLRCNLSCQHCGSDCKKDAAVKDMPLADFLGAIDQLNGLVNPNKTMIVLTGGEVLMRTDLAEIGQSLYDRGFPWGMVTNGMLLNEQKLQLLVDSGLRAVTVSLDGLEESHNWLRGNPSSFKKAISAIRFSLSSVGFTSVISRQQIFLFCMNLLIRSSASLSFNPLPTGVPVPLDMEESSESTSKLT